MHLCNVNIFKTLGPETAGPMSGDKTSRKRNFEFWPGISWERWPMPTGLLITSDSRKRLFNWSSLFDCMSVCLSVRITAKVISWLHCNLELWLDLSIGRTWLTAGDDPVPDTDSRSLFHFPHHCSIGDFRRFISISHTFTSHVLQHSEKWLMTTVNSLNPN